MVTHGLLPLVLACLLCTPALAQDSEAPPAATAPAPTTNGATIPIMRAPAAESAPEIPVGGAGRWGNGSGQPSQPGTQIAPASTASAPAPAAPSMMITRPVQEQEIQPKPLPRVETPSQIAADQAIRKDADTKVSAYAEQVSDTCGADLHARIDWTSVGADEIHVGSPQDACGAALQAIEEICSNESAKRQVASQIKMVICTAGPTPKVELHAGTLLYTLDWQSRNPGATVYAWLASHL